MDKQEDLFNYDPSMYVSFISEEGTIHIIPLRAAIFDNWIKDLAEVSKSMPQDAATSGKDYLLTVETPSGNSYPSKAFELHMRFYNYKAQWSEMGETRIPAFPKPEEFADPDHPLRMFTQLLCGDHNMITHKKYGL